jgi:hypothetical protein
MFLGLLGGRHCSSFFVWIFKELQFVWVQLAKKQQKNEQDLSSSLQITFVRKFLSSHMLNLTQDFAQFSN